MCGNAPLKSYPTPPTEHARITGSIRPAQPGLPRHAHITSEIGPAQPGHTPPRVLIPIRHRAKGIEHRVSVPADSDMGTWGHFPPCRLGPPSVLHRPSGHSNNTSQVGCGHFRSTHIHSTRQVLAQSGGNLGRGT
eukprot:3768692-Amphidinium_carterae.1